MCKNPAGCRIYIKRIIACKADSRAKIDIDHTKAEYILKAPSPLSPFPCLFFFLLFLFFCLSKFFGRLEPPPPLTDENSWIRAWHMKYIQKIHMKYTCFQICMYCIYISYKIHMFCTTYEFHIWQNCMCNKTNKYRWHFRSKPHQTTSLK